MLSLKIYIYIYIYIFEDKFVFSEATAKNILERMQAKGFTDMSRMQVHYHLNIQFYFS